MTKIILQALFIAAFFGSISATFSTGADEESSIALSDLSSQCLNEALLCFSGKGLVNHGQVIEQKLKHLETEVAELKAQLANAGQPGGFAVLDSNARLPQGLLAAGYNQYSAFDLAWQSLHMAAAAACRGSTPSGGKGCCPNKVIVKNEGDSKDCAKICAASSYPNCDAEVSIYGRERKASKNGEIVGSFYNYSCNRSSNAGSEVSSSDQGVMSESFYFSFCCCRK